MNIYRGNVQRLQALLGFVWSKKVIGEREKKKRPVTEWEKDACFNTFLYQNKYTMYIFCQQICICTHTHQYSL